MSVFQKSLNHHLSTFEQVKKLETQVETVAKIMIQSLERGGKILWCGNGGSAADSQHLAAELIGRFTRERRALPAIALTTDSSILTAVANDYQYERIFSRQVEGLCTKLDILVGISTSGQSPNVIEAIRSAKNIGAQTIAFTGRDGGLAAQIADFSLNVAEKDTARIQEAHIFLGHVLCDLIEAHFAAHD